MSGTHFHFVIWAAQEKVGSQFDEITYVDVAANSESEAIEKAKKLAPGRRHYHVNNIVEHHDHAGGEH